MEILDRKDWFDKEIKKLDNNLDSLTYKYVLDFSETILEILDKNKVKNKNKYLSKKLKCSPAYISKLFNGRSNLTVRKLIELSKAVDYELKINLRPKLVQIQLPVLYTFSVNVQGRLENYASDGDQQTVELGSIPGPLQLTERESVAA
jgi:transcriptional regulator with XRE-family HTH domain